ncbi:hypothetical protein [Ketobacter sp. GenoA1]|uniref:hypothetical protein n=1 Tax=Ketobacter sp. GenoA1 TaxID=2072747 RepID=UPI000F19C730|nr:hypothetical protein [Ketobacter sp. GenoA1]RLT89653.1 MAG: hypothetical protein D9N13_11820 [Ketobacter sp. GenoA1]
MISESDWKKFKKIREKALDKFCSLALEDIQEALNKKDADAHSRYLYVYKIVENNDKRLSLIFDDYRRSKARIQLALMVSSDLVDEQDLNVLSDDLQEFIAKNG